MTSPQTPAAGLLETLTDEQIADIDAKPERTLHESRVGRDRAIAQAQARHTLKQVAKWLRLYPMAFAGVAANGLEIALLLEAGKP